MKKIKINQNNFIKKILIKVIRKLGFELIDQNNLTVPTSEKSLDDNLNILNKKNIVLPLGEVDINRKVENLLLIFRSFTNENNLLTQNKKRLFEKEKKEYTLLEVDGREKLGAFEFTFIVNIYFFPIC